MTTSMREGLSALLFLRFPRSPELGHNWAMTTRAEFAALVERTLQEVIVCAQEHTRTALPRKMKFRWLGHDVVLDQGIVEAIVTRVYLGPESIYPCVDIGVGDLSMTVANHRCQRGRIRSEAISEELDRP